MDNDYYNKEYLEDELDYGDEHSDFDRIPFDPRFFFLLFLIPYTT